MFIGQIKAISKYDNNRRIQVSCPKVDTCISINRIASVELLYLGGGQVNKNYNLPRIFRCMFLNVVLLYILVIKRKTPYTIINIALRSINIQQSITF